MKGIKLWVGISCCLFSLFSTESLMAVDGYKNLKFGISSEELKKSKFCTFKTLEKNIKGVNIIYCSDFQFNKELRLGAFFFIKNKFLQLSITIPYDDSFLILKILKKKYGARSSNPSDIAHENYDKFANQELWIGFDKNTVYLRYHTDGAFKRSAALLFTSPLFKEFLDKKMTENILNDL